MIYVCFMSVIEWVIDLYKFFYMILLLDFVIMVDMFDWIYYDNYLKVGVNDIVEYQEGLIVFDVYYVQGVIDFVVVWLCEVFILIYCWVGISCFIVLVFIILCLYNEKGVEGEFV